MERPFTKGVLSHLSLLEAQARSGKNAPRQPSRVTELRAKVAALVKRRDELKEEEQTRQDLQKLRASMDKACEEEQEMDEDSENSQLLWLMAKHTQLKDLLNAHHLIGGYDIIKTSHGKGVCVSLATSYDGVYLETYHLEMDLKPTMRIRRHNIPPFVPLNNLVEQSDVQTSLRAFLDLLSLHLNALAARKQQLKLVKEQHESVEVLESNVLCSLLVLMVTGPQGKPAVLCTLDYADPTRCLPTRVHVESKDKDLPDSAEWTRICSLFKETPVHKALTAMKNMGIIA